MLPFYEVGGIGTVFVPTQFREIASDRPIKIFHSESPNRIFNHIRRDGIAVLTGEIDQISEAIEFVDQRKNELEKRSNRGKKDRDRKRDRRQKRDPQPLSRLMFLANADGNLQLEPSPEIPFLIELIGDHAGSNENCPFLVSIEVIEKIQTAMKQTYEIESLETPLIAIDPVLPPRSQETAALFQQGMWYAKNHLPKHANVLDLGCGSGVLTILATRRLASCKPKITATDILPEAIAVTKINLSNFDLRGATVDVRCGDLFEPIADQKFDLILFNAPWVIARVRSRTEIATSDQDQKIVRRFFDQVRSHLNPNGRILLGYADHSGEKYVERLQKLIIDHGFEVVSLFKERVSTHRSKRKWQHIFVFELMRV